MGKCWRCGEMATTAGCGCSERVTVSPIMRNDGWRCPVCKKGNAPHATKCGHCAEADTKPQTAVKTYNILQETV